MEIRPLAEIGAYRPLCEHKVRVSATPSRTAHNRAIDAKRKGIPVDQCGKPADFRVDGVPICRAHAGARALEHIIAESRPRTDADEIARPRCGCPPETVRRVVIEHGTCGMGGCPYGGDV